MANRLHVGTRKGLFEVARRNGAWEVADAQFLGDPVSAVLADTDGAVYAALDLGHFGAKLWRRDRAGAWSEVAVPAFPPKPGDDGDDPHPWSLGKIWVLEPGGAAGRLWAGTMPGGLFRSDDAGASWSLNDALWHMPERAAVGGRRRRRAARHQFRADRPAQSLRHPHRRVDRGRVGQHRRRWLVASDQPRHVCRVHAAGAARGANRPGRPPAGALRRASRNRVVSAPQRRLPFGGFGRHLARADGNPPVEVRLRRGGASARP